MMKKNIQGIKGVIQMAVEIEYDKILTEDKFEALSAFTGKKTPEEIMTLHMNNIVRDLQEIVKDKAGVKFGVNGNLVAPEPQEESAPLVEDTSSLEEAEKNFSPVEEIPELEEVYVTEPYVEEPAKPVLDIVSLLDKDLEDVTVNYGLPQLIRVSAETYEQISEHIRGYSVVNRDGSTKEAVSYKGYDIEVEGQEELYVIVYKKSDNTLAGYSRKYS